ncbi:MAG TPA: hypothetical protein VHB53_05315 [Solirubrobacterales bacterium]|nr:hypothetical protein [Solirubrobacterales bacterium]
MKAARRVPVWGGLIVALLGWGVGFQTPGPGIDPSWNAGLAMAVDQGLRFGKEVVFTYGPLGFLNSRMVFFGGLSVLSFIYAAALYVLFCIGLVWALRRALPLLAALAVAFVAVAWLPMPLLEVGLLSAVFACFWLLGAERSGRALDLFVVAAATFAAPAALVKLSTGPLVAVILLIALVGARAGGRRIAAYVVLFLAEVLALWLATGQSLGDVPAFVGHTIEISAGYSSAMLRSTDVAPWKVTAAVAAAIVSGLALVTAVWRWGGRGSGGGRGARPDRATRWAGAAIAALVYFGIYKEGVVRVDAGHLTVLFANAAVLWIAVGPGVRRPGPMLAAAAIVFAISLPVRPAGLETRFDPVANVRFAVEGARDLFGPGRRDTLIGFGRAAMESSYGLAPPGLAALRGHTVAVEPWEIGAAWAYGLDWRPLPVFQNYSAYTPALDRLNAAAVEDPDGPERILRHNTEVVQPEFPTADLDDRFLGWDPPEQARAVLCDFAPLWADERWQVLGRVPDRCGPERRLGTASAAAGEAVRVPAPGPREVVFARIDGAGVSGLERVQTFLFHAASRHAVVNGETRYRLVPETAGDGLLLRAAPGVVEPGPFDPVPEARTLAVEGGSDRITYTFYAMRVRRNHRMATKSANATG